MEAAGKGLVDIVGLVGGHNHETEELFQRLEEKRHFLIGIKSIVITIFTR